jgi:hypothetical protein
MKITTEWLKKKSACSEGVAWFLSQKETEAILILEALMEDDKFDWANWLIVRVMKRPQYLAYAIFAAESVIHIWAKKYPDDKRPQKAIQAANAVLKNDTEQNRAGAAEAAGAAGAAAAAGAAVAARAAVAAVAAEAAGAAVAAGAAGAAVAAVAAGAARKNMQIKILNYGLDLLTGGREGR